MNANTPRYTLLIDASDTNAIVTANALFRNLIVAPSPDDASFTELTFDATDLALDAYASIYSFDPDEFRDMLVTDD